MISFLDLIPFHNKDKKGPIKNKENKSGRIKNLSLQARIAMEKHRKLGTKGANRLRKTQ